MRLFEHGNWGSGHVCPICGTAEDKPVVLIGIAGTEEGNNIQAKSFHLDCLEFICYEGSPSILVASFDDNSQRESLGQDAEGGE